MDCCCFAVTSPNSLLILPKPASISYLRPSSATSATVSRRGRLLDSSCSIFRGRSFRGAAPHPVRPAGLEYIPGSRRTGPTCRKGAEDEGFGWLPDPLGDLDFADRADGPSGEDGEVVTLTEPGTGRRLRCGIEAEVRWRKTRYMACYPREQPVLLARRVGKRHEVVQHGLAPDALFTAARTAALDKNCVLSRTGFFWTMEELGESEEVGSFQIADGLSERDLEKELENIDDDVEDEEAQIVAEFDYEGSHYYVVLPMEPILLVVKQIKKGFVIPPESEMKRVNPLLEKEIENIHVDVPTL